jgi:hypothetical protein
MNSQFSLRRDRIVSPTTALVWMLGIAATAVILCACMWASLPPANDDSFTRRPLPAGQLQADARTFFAALDFLLDHSPDLGLPAAAMASCPSNFQLTLPSAFCCVSNQAELLCEPVTNVPARS